MTPGAGEPRRDFGYDIGLPASLRIRSIRVEDPLFHRRRENFQPCHRRGSRALVKNGISDEKVDGYGYRCTDKGHKATCDMKALLVIAGCRTFEDGYSRGL
jgi:hypothetical protein